MGEGWLANWLDSVANGKAKMSQRALLSIEKHGGLETAIAAAQARNLHLIKVVDERGMVVVAASLHPFETLC